VDAGGRELIASPFLDELTRVVPEFVEHAVARTAVAPLSTVRAPADFQARVALEALSSPKTRLSARSELGAPLGEHFRDQPWFERARFVSTMEEERLSYFSDLSAPPRAFSGDLTAAALDGARAEKFAFSAAAPVSISALGRYANCAFQGFLEQVLKLQAVEEQGEEPDVRTRGTFWHLVFEQLMPRMRDRKWLALPVQSLPPDELNQLIDGAIDDAAKKAESQSAVGHPALWKLGRDKARRMVRRVLFSESEGQPFKEHGWYPDAVEQNFGPRATDPRFAQVVVPAARPGEADVFLNGKIDRIDLGPGGAGVVDYKAGKKKGNDASRKLLVSDFQLPAYVLALRQSLGLSDTDAAWLYLGDHEPLTLSDLLAKKQTLDELMRLDLEGRALAEQEGKKNLANAVHAVIGRIRAGDLGARPQDCANCNFSRVCRISQRRIGDEVG
jgi:RecB family exonuclease